MGIRVMGNIVNIVVDKTVFNVVVVRRLVRFRGRRPRWTIGCVWERLGPPRDPMDVPCKNIGCDVTTQR